MLDKKYDHLLVEQDKYSNWCEKGYFESGDLSLKPYAIVIPPPNVTGKLHLGHAWDTTLQDLLIRYKRMDGYDALWVPGMDHAGIATQAKVDERLKNSGIDPRGMSREEWVKKAFEWKDEYASTIKAQWAKLGLSLDYTKERFTLDEGLSEAVNYVFIEMYNKGLIYRGERIINFDPKAMTALSNIEVIYKEKTGNLYHIKYFVKGSDDYLVVATTRPETLFGDTALCVNPNDDRFKDYIGKTVIVPSVNREITVIGDEYVDMEFGTGVLKVTPAHDPNDFELGTKHNLEFINVMNKNGTLNHVAGIYENMDRDIVRTKLVEELKEKDLIVKIEEILHQVGYSERTDVVVEPILSKQWFVKMDELSKMATDTQNSDNKVNFIPERFEKIYLNWMDGTFDWCISRQLWWGHRIPAWYKDDEVIVSKECPGEGYTQDNDVLDTWFSSALWPFSTLGFPNKDDELYKRYFPLDCLVTGYDIIFFWVSRMIFQSLEFTGSIPFKDVLIHGLVRDNQGRKMSKSLGNGVDPMDVIERYGADSLRTYLVTSVSAGQDLRYDEEKVASNWNFINKLWNATRFVLMNMEDLEIKSITEVNLESKDKWILTHLNNLIKEVRKHLDNYDFNLAFTEIYDFVWNKYCSYYIELSKASTNVDTMSVHNYVLCMVVKLLHPFMPFVTEELYLSLNNNDETIVKAAFPVVNENYIFPIETSNIDDLIEFITIARNRKLELKIRDVKYAYVDESNESNLIKSILKITDEKDDNYNDFTCITIKHKNYCVTYYYDSLENDNEEKELLKKEYETLLASISKRENLLSNENYVNKAPANVVLMDRKKLEEEKTKLAQIKDKIN